MNEHLHPVHRSTEATRRAADLALRMDAVDFRGFMTSTSQATIDDLTALLDAAAGGRDE